MSYNFQKILDNRQSNREPFNSQNKACTDMYNRYVDILNWIDNNKKAFTRVLPDHYNEIEGLECRIKTQKDQLEKLRTGTLQQYSSRLNREWISFAAVGAKRQGKGHTLSTLLGLQPENDLFLARSGDACTATVVTLYQGPKREPRFNDDNEFIGWEVKAENKAFIYSYTVSEVVKIIESYFKAIDLPNTFDPNINTIAAFKKECKRCGEQLPKHTSSRGDMEYFKLLKAYLTKIDQYADLLKERETDDEPIKPIDVTNITGEKFENDELRKYITYWPRTARTGDDQVYHVLAVKKVDVYTNYNLGGSSENAFVICDTAGIGEYKLGIKETLKTVLRNEVDIAIGVTKFYKDVISGDSQFSQDVADFHAAISDCFVSSPHQFYYIINVPKEVNATKEQKEKFRNDLIEDLRLRRVIPSAGDVKYGFDSRWTETEVSEWMTNHVKLLDSSDFSEVNGFIKDTILPQVSEDLSLIDKKLLADLTAELAEQEKSYRAIVKDMNSFVGRIPLSNIDVEVEKKEKIKNQILIPMRDAFEGLITSISNLDAGNLPIVGNDTLNIVAESLEKFKAVFSEFYMEPDSLRTITCVLPNKNVNEVLTESDKKICKEKKSKLYSAKIAYAKPKNNEEEYALRAAYEAAYKDYKTWQDEWQKGKYDSLVKHLKVKIVYALEALDDDELKTLVEYRSSLINNLVDVTDEMFTDNVTKAYELVIDMIWKIIEEKGRFNKLNKGTVVESLSSNRYGKIVMNGLNDFKFLDINELCAAPNKLRDGLKADLARSKVVPVIYDSTRAQDVDDMIARSIANHLITIEMKYKVAMYKRFKEETLLVDFQKSISEKVAKINNYLLPQPVTIEYYQKTQEAFMNFYLEEYAAFFPDDTFTEKELITKNINKLKELL